ncbi:hypothetical protein BGZ65_002771 [Modicella reniformis]|uniref:Uncharacterized protein n=1 Tax=Modicella reniformis TaxID=1440133 RepID=A0A9P6M9J6_9FUNG|nr:hypothetical protein BGZ65_002771 [Modicella reniformis]
MENYDEEKAIQDAIELSLDECRKGEGNQIEFERRHSSSKSSSNRTTKINKDTSRRSSGIQGKAEVAGKRQIPKNGGNSSQMLIDPWLSARALSQESEDRYLEDSKNVSHSAHRQHLQGEPSRRTSFGRSRFEHEPMALISTSVTSPVLHFTSPRKVAAGVEEVTCSPHMTNNKTRDISESNKNNGETILSSSPTSGRQNKKGRLSPKSSIFPGTQIYFITVH